MVGIEEIDATFCKGYFFREKSKILKDFKNSIKVYLEYRILLACLITKNGEENRLHRISTFVNARKLEKHSLMLTKIVIGKNISFILNFNFEFSPSLTFIERTQQ